MLEVNPHLPFKFKGAFLKFKGVVKVVPKVKLEEKHLV
jgi:hypothetical protein